MSNQITKYDILHIEHLYQVCLKSVWVFILN